MSRPTDGDLLRLVPTAMAAGGAAVGREPTGRVVLVDGALPGETVDVVLTEERTSYARARVCAVLDPSPDRVAPPCPHVARGCGGCGWQHVSLEAQRRYKARVVSEALERTGGVEGAMVLPAQPAGLAGYRTTLRLTSDGARPGFRRHRSHEVVPVDSCLVAHPLLAELLSVGDFGEATNVTLRCGARTGERLAILGPSSAGASLPGSVRVIGEDELAAGRRAWIFEEVAGKRLRLSAESFFQASPEGAEVLVRLVGSAIAGSPEGPLVDAYGGVGLLAATVAASRPVTLLECSAPAAADARVNLPAASVRRTDVARWRASKAAVVVADPPRAGLGAAGVAALVASRPSHLALVSCDPASLGRDASLLRARGFRLEWAALVDLFPGTPHIEVVSRFVRC
ncbi:MAG TPA: TRAM domain-containing protein [Acidimicrobiales bacterium]|nr:TRAM domain-containing protein [Acidimicrobiales bacterium]